MMQSLSIFILGIILIAAKVSGEILPDVIYGNDSRRDLHELANSKGHYKSWARSTAIINYVSKIVGSSLPGFKKIKTKSLQMSRNVCLEEPYAQQPVGGWCTGFLVKEDVMVTAGHCIETKSQCANSAFIFDYGYSDGLEELNYVKEENIFYCKEVLKHKFAPPRGLDYAIVKLDRKVEGRMPLKLRVSGQVSSDTSLTVIGHPTGLPTKIAEGAYVRDNTNPNYFVCNTDTYGGNSGSPIFNQEGIVEGVLVRGERDFVRKGACNISYRCGLDNCRGEDVTRSTAFAHLIP